MTSSEGTTRYRFERLTRQHKRDAFDCGEPVINQYLRQQARQEQDRHAVAVCWVLLDGQADDMIVGFHTLSSTAIDRGSVSSPDRPWVGYEQIPAILIGRIGVDRRYQGRNLGRFLLFDAIDRAVQAAQQVAAAFIVLDAKNEELGVYYQDLHFIPAPNNSLRLYLPMDRAMQLVAAASKVM